MADCHYCVERRTLSDGSYEFSVMRAHNDLGWDTTPVIKKSQSEALSQVLAFMRTDRNWQDHCFYSVQGAPWIVVYLGIGAPDIGEASDDKY
jgi:hypothetical protein